jgi:hypothetical protein
MISFETPHYSPEQLRETESLDSKKIDWWKETANIMADGQEHHDETMIEMWKRFSSFI